MASVRSAAVDCVDIAFDLKMNLIEIFVEKNCKECSKATAVAQSYARESNTELRIFDREHDLALFQARHVVICPATFVNNRLLFYGEFTSEELRKHLNTGGQTYSRNAKSKSL